MVRTACFFLALLGATAATATAQNFLLGLDYSEPIPTGPLTGPTGAKTATDQQGNVYVLVGGWPWEETSNGMTFGSDPGGPSYLVKLTPAGTVVYQTTLAFPATALAIDAAGYAYLAGINLVEKLGTDGTTVIYQTTIGGSDLTVKALAVDSLGRIYVTGTSSAGDVATTPGAFQPGPSPTVTQLHGFVMRLKPSGAIDYGSYLDPGQPSSIAVDASGAALVAGEPLSTDFPTTPGAYLTRGYGFLLRLSADGSALIYSTYTEPSAQCCLVVDSAGDATLALENIDGTRSQVVRFDPQGAPKVVATLSGAALALAVDSAGNIYIATAAAINYPSRNSLAPCSSLGSAVLTVLDSGGNVLQATYIPGLSNDYNLTAMSLAPDSTVSIFGAPDPGYAPSQNLAGSPSALLQLTRLSQNAKAQTVQLACVGNAANYTSYSNRGIAGGEIVSLFGQGLGPTAGTQPQVNVQTGFPTKLAGVQVTFNGTPGPLLYVQDSQINAISPWALQTGQPVEICVVYNGAPTNCMVRTAVDADPGVFTVDGVFAVALNQDGSFNSASHPANGESIVTVFATGLGAINPAQPDGSIVGFPLPANVLPVTMYTYNGVPFFDLFTFFLTINYAGPAPIQVAGVSQINFTPFSAGYPITLQVGQGTCTFRLYF